MANDSLSGVKDWVAVLEVKQDCAKAATLDDNTAASAAKGRAVDGSARP